MQTHLNNMNQLIMKALYFPERRILKQIENLKQQVDQKPHLSGC